MFDEEQKENILIESDLKLFSQKSGLVIMNNKPIGTGGFSKVFLASRNNSVLAVKIMITTAEENNPKTMKRKLMAKEEIIVTSNLKNRNCIKYIAMFELEHSMSLVMEYANNGDLSSLTSMFYKDNLFYNNLPGNTLATNWFKFMSENFIRFFIKQIINSLSYLHKMDMVHRDLKLNNLLITRDLTLKLSDFALAAQVPRKGEFILKESGTLIYMPPESFNPNTRCIDCNDAYKADYYALGVILYKMLFNEFIWKDEKTISYLDFRDKLKQIEHDENQTILFKRGKGGVSKEAVSLLKKLLNFDMSKRMSFEGLRSDQWVNKNNLRINFLSEAYKNDSVKLLLELQKSDYYNLCNATKKSKSPLKLKYYHFSINKSPPIYKKPRPLEKT
jgi:serine/threonine protein kinase